MLQKMMEAYKAWHVFHQKFPRQSRYTLGGKIDNLFTELFELLLIASYASAADKYRHIISASTKLDVLKYFIQVAWELKCIDHKGYAVLISPLGEIGKMIGGWTRYAERKTPPI